MTTINQKRYKFSAENFYCFGTPDIFHEKLECFPDYCFSIYFPIAIF